MDIDKEFLLGLGNPLDDMPSKEIEHSKKKDAIDEKHEICKPFTSRKERGHFEKKKDNSDEEVASSKGFEKVASFVIETEKAVMSDESEISESEIDETEGHNCEVIEPSVTQESYAFLEENFSRILKEVTEIKTSMTKFDGYDKAVETLRLSLAANQHNEENIYTELESYKKNQYYNYIRPFLEFLINLLTDMINSQKQYEDEKDKFISNHDEEVYDDIINLHNYYIEQIKSQLQVQGVEIISYEPETPFISTEQMISKTIPSDDPQLAGNVGRVDSDCYKFEDKIIKKAKVHVYKFNSTKKGKDNE